MHGSLLCLFYGTFCRHSILNAILVNVCGCTIALTTKNNFSTLLNDDQAPKRLPDRTLVTITEESTTVCLHDDGKVVIHHTSDAGEWLRNRYARLKAMVDARNGVVKRETGDG